MPLRGSGSQIAGTMVSISPDWRYPATGIFNGVTEVTPHPMKTQGFHHFFILLFYDHPADGEYFKPASF